MLDVEQGSGDVERASSSRSFYVARTSLFWRVMSTKLDSLPEIGTFALR